MEPATLVPCASQFHRLRCAFKDQVSRVQFCESRLEAIARKARGFQPNSDGLQHLFTLLKILSRLRWKDCWAPLQTLSPRLSTRTRGSLRLVSAESAPALPSRCSFPASALDRCVSSGKRPRSLDESVRVVISRSSRIRRPCGKASLLGDLLGRAFGKGVSVYSATYKHMTLYIYISNFISIERCKHILGTVAWVLGSSATQRKASTK